MSAVSFSSTGLFSDLILPFVSSVSSRLSMLSRLLNLCLSLFQLDPTLGLFPLSVSLSHAELLNISADKLDSESPLESVL